METIQTAQTAQSAHTTQPRKLAGITEKEQKIFGIRHKYLQIEQTVSFEFKRNGMKLLAMMITSAGVFVLFLLIQVITENRGAEPSDPAQYISSFLGMISFLILIIASTFASTIIAEDFEKETGNLIFPKITRGRLLIGRIIARMVYTALSIMFFYLLVGIATYIKYEAIPKEMWGSMGWAVLYGFLILSLITFFSSFMKRSATALVVGILLVLIVFQLLTMILMYTGVTIEPLFMITYYANIITSWFAMPAIDARYVEMPFGRGPEAMSGNTFYQWITPSPVGALIGMLLYSAALLGFAYIIFRRRQN